MTDRVQVPDPAFLRLASRRTTRAAVIVAVLTTFFTAGGISLVRAGELPGLPFAVGGLVLQASAVALLIATRRVRRTLDGETVARSALVGARRTAAGVRRVALATIVALIGYGFVRLVFGDPWSLLTGLIIGIGLFLLARGSRAVSTVTDVLSPPWRR